MKYRIDLTEEQYYHIARSVETVHRIACGDLLALRAILPIAPDDALLYEIKEQAFPELHANEEYGWNGGYRNTVHGEDFRRVFDAFQAQGYQIYRQMLHMGNIARGIDNVYTSPTLTTSKAQQPVIKIIRK